MMFWIFVILIVGGIGVAYACIDTRGPSAPILPPRPRAQARPHRRSTRDVRVGVAVDPSSRNPTYVHTAAVVVHTSSFDHFDNPSDSSSFDGGGSFGGFDGGCGGGDCGGCGD